MRAAKSWVVRTPWDVLGIKVGASPAEVRAAHRRLSFLLHPDRCDDPDAHARMVEVNAARDVLLAAARGWASADEPPPGPSTAMARWRRPNPWDAAVAPETVRGALTDLAA